MLNVVVVVVQPVERERESEFKLQRVQQRQVTNATNKDARARDKIITHTHTQCSDYYYTHYIPQNKTIFFSSVSHSLCLLCHELKERISGFLAV